MLHHKRWLSLKEKNCQSSRSRLESCLHLLRTHINQATWSELERQDMAALEKSKIIIISKITLDVEIMIHLRIPPTSQRKCPIKSEQIDQKICKKLPQILLTKLWAKNTINQWTAAEAEQSKFFFVYLSADALWAVLSCFITEWRILYNMPICILLKFSITHGCFSLLHIN